MAKKRDPAELLRIEAERELDNQQREWEARKAANDARNSTLASAALLAIQVEQEIAQKKQAAVQKWESDQKASAQREAQAQQKEWEDRKAASNKRNEFFARAALLALKVEQDSAQKQLSAAQAVAQVERESAEKKRTAASAAVEREAKVALLAIQVEQESAQKKQALGLVQERRGRELLEVEAKAALAVAQKKQAESPAGRMAAATKESQGQTAGLREQAKYLGTAEGKEGYRGMLGAQRQAEEAKELVLKRQQVALYGQVGATMRQFGTGLETLSPHINAARAAFGKIVGLVGRASPNAEGALSGSVGLLEAKIGTLLIPMVNNVSALVQRLANLVPDKESKQGKAFKAGASELTYLGPQWYLPPSLRKKEHQGSEEKPELPSMAGLPRPMIGSPEQYQMSLQMAALQPLPGTIEAAQLKIEMRNLAEQFPNLIKALDRNTDRGVTFR